MAANTRIAAAMRSVAALSLALVVIPILISHQAVAQTIQCTGVEDSAPLQAAANVPNANILIRGTCRLTIPLTFLAHNISLRGEGGAIVWEGGPEPAIVINGAQGTSVFNLIVHSSGAGVAILGGALNSRFHQVIVTALAGAAFNLGDGAGFWLTQSRVNGNPGSGAAAVSIAGPWDTAMISDLLSEEFDTCLRLGGTSGSVASILVTNIICDRLRLLALHIEPSGSGAVASIQITNMNALRGIAPALINASQTNGYVGAISLTNWNMQQIYDRQYVWLAGPVDSSRITWSQMTYR